MKILFVVGLVIGLAFLTPNLSLSYEQDIPCVGGKCDGWQIRYATTGNSNRYLFQCVNEMNKPAFRVICRINFLDSFNKPLGKTERRHDGPINKWVIFQNQVPPGTFKMTGEVYYLDETQAYGSTAQDVLSTGNK